MTVTDSDTIILEQFATETPCDGPCDPSASITHWVVYFGHQCEPDDQLYEMLLCLPCYTLAIDPRATVPCAGCGERVVFSDYVIDHGAL